MVMGGQILETKTIDVARLENTVKTAREKMKAAVKTVVVANRLQELNDDFTKYLEHKRDVAEAKFSSRLPTQTMSRDSKDDSASGQGLDAYYKLGELVSINCLHEKEFVTSERISHQFRLFSLGKDNLRRSIVESTKFRERSMP
jgi:hypothetical protein